MQMRNFIFLMFGDRKHHFIIIKYKERKKLSRIITVNALKPLKN